MQKEKRIVANMTNASISFDKRTVLDNVTIELDSGTILGLIGPSGAGKTPNRTNQSGEYTLRKCFANPSNEGNTDAAHAKLLEKRGTISGSVDF